MKHRSAPSGYIINSFITWLLLFLSVLKSYGQHPDTSKNNNASIKLTHQLHIKATAAPVELDGVLSDEAWQQAQTAGDFWIKWPRDDQKAAKKTVVRASYDNRFLYISAVCYDTSSYVIQTLKRDSRFFQGDGFGIVLDPVNQRTNGFFFGVSPFNVQSEDLVTQSAFGDLAMSWDNKWYSATKRYSDYWTVEVAIPFKTLRFQAGKTEWGVSFFRNDLKTFQYHSWTPVPVNFEIYDLGYTGTLVWDTAPQRTKGNLNVIPYLTGSVIQDGRIKGKLNGGFDAKLAISSSLNLDVTVNPDFSQIEVDRQQTNLTRFNLFYPERRTFFLENADIFSDFGTPPARPFFSRRIGLDANGNAVPILAGARISGNLNKNLRLGAMNIQTQGLNGSSAQNYTAVALHQRVFNRSLIKGYLTNRQAFSGIEGFKKNDYGRNAGLELNYRNVKGSWNTWAGYHLSGKPGIKTDNAFGNLAFSYSGRNFSVFTDYIHMGTNYYADMGFINRIENYDAVQDTIIRLGFEHIYNEIGYSFRRNNSKSVIAHNFRLSTMLDYNPDGSFNERNSTFGYEIQFRKTSELGFSVSEQDVHLLFPITFTDAKPLPKDAYKFRQFSIDYESDARRMFAYEFEATVGGFYNGKIRSYNVQLTYRKQPWGNFSLGFERNELEFPGEYGSAILSLIGQRTEINFSNSLFWTTFLQYNTQGNNFNINSRLQWRYKPMSDFYLVYTDNYFTNPFLQNKNRAIVFKVNYWL